MRRPKQFRIILPALQIALALFVGGWGEWLRYSVLNHPFFGGTFWDSTARFHVWPLPLKFTLVLNLPVLVGGALLSVPLDAVHLPAPPEWLSCLTMLPFVALFWYWIGSRVDRNRAGGPAGQTAKRHWIALLLFAVCCVLASSVPIPNGGYTSFLELGILLWLIAAIVAMRFLAFRAKNPEIRATENFGPFQ